MITTLNTLSQLKQLYLEIFLNKTNRVSDVSDNSNLNANAYGVAKIAQKAQKDIAIAVSLIMPDSAVGMHLDNSATLFGVPARKGASASSTNLRVVASPNTQYLASTHVFSNYNGIQFRLEEDVTVGTDGIAYLPVRSVETGLTTNVDPISIIQVTPVPAGHINVINEYRAEGGLDAETDELFRQRIKRHLNILSRNTLAYLTQVFIAENSDVLRLFNLGLNEQGKRTIAIATVNGKNLTQTELDDLLENVTNFFGIDDVSKFGEAVGIRLQNIVYTLIDVDFRVQIEDNFNVDTVRKQIQTNISKYLDFRTWQQGRAVEWDDLLQIVKDTEGVRFVPDQFFTPNIDRQVPINTLPRVRGFIMRDLSGNIISDTQGVLTPVFYPNGAAS